MSSIYILEPQTSGKVLLKTTVGDIDIELWAKETPKACRNFIQLCLEGYYNNLIFHRVVKDFIVQGGDPNGDGTGGESIYGEPFKDEFHQRLKFARRGLVAMANAGKDDNGSQFFFTLGPTPELQNKHTIFGKITGETVFNMLKLEEGLVEDERPVYPNKIIKAEVLNNPFPDIVPRFQKVEVKEKQKKEKKAGVKNFKLLSFGAEAEEDEEEFTRVNKNLSGKGKSTHDVLDDPTLSSQTEAEAVDEPDPSTTTEKQLENIKKKLQGAKQSKPKSQKRPLSPKETKGSDDEFEDYYLGKDRKLEKEKKMQELKEEIKNIKKDYHKNKLRKEEEKTIEQKEEEVKSEVVREYKEEYNTYKVRKEKLPQKGSDREKFTLALLDKFKKKLHTAKEKEQNKDEEKPEENEEDDERSWLSHNLKFEDDTPILAKDANTKDDDWFEIYDPRHPLAKRRRGEGDGSSRAKK
ncbi:spliceosome-associated protein CWC27 homolog [Diabrotica virgifera virgifera]|uniref:Spliceosome-associated protein CWC27 homolog n=1 Tax=Diabrotica virgifera virgifera TaxID=50390 RepID=A0ABM5KK99_DIAVI|nr:spliceosome-associated protein CWC27 homolog [Diabrotica virgifera virgifera]